MCGTRQKGLCPVPTRSFAATKWGGKSVFTTNFRGVSRRAIAFFKHVLVPARALLLLAFGLSNTNPQPFKATGECVCNGSAVNVAGIETKCMQAVVSAGK